VVTEVATVDALGVSVDDALGGEAGASEPAVPRDDVSVVLLLARVLLLVAASPMVVRLLLVVVGVGDALCGVPRSPARHQPDCTHDEHHGDSADHVRCRTSAKVIRSPPPLARHVESSSDGEGWRWIRARLELRGTNPMTGRPSNAWTPTPASRPLSPGFRWWKLSGDVPTVRPELVVCPNAVTSS
jgi:hypothetical protein